MSGNPFSDPTQQHGQQPYGQQPAGPAFKDPEKEARSMAMLSHLLGALLGFLGPLIIYLIKKDEHPFIHDQSKEALNFQLTMIIFHLIGGVIAVVSCGFLFFVPFLTLIMQIVFGLIGMSQANNGVWYRYPICIRFVT